MTVNQRYNCRHRNRRRSYFFKGLFKTILCVAGCLTAVAAVLAVSRWFFSQMADSVLSTEAAAASYKVGGSGNSTFKDSKGASGSLDSGGENWKEYKTELEAMAKTNPKVEQIIENREVYPDELFKLLALNEETVDFILDYPSKKDLAPANTIGEVTRGQIPLLLQWDERWGYASYGGELMALSGCGPTCLAMVAAGLTGNAAVTPYEVARYAEQNGFYVAGEGSSWTLMSEGGAAFGVTGRELPLSENMVMDCLLQGQPVICSMRPGDFTTTGHFIVLVGVKDGQIQVNDPNSRERSEKLWDWSTLEYQITNLWAFSKN